MPVLSKNTKKVAKPKMAPESLADNFGTKKAGGTTDSSDAAKEALVEARESETANAVDSGEAKSQELNPSKRGRPTTKIPKKSNKGSNQDPLTRYDLLRELSKGIIAADPLSGGVKDRGKILEQYGLRTAAGNRAATVRIKFGLCLVDKDEVMEAATGCQVALVRGTTSSKDYTDKFVNYGWDGQYAGMSTIHVTEKVADVMLKMTLVEQHAWLLDPRTHETYAHYIIDGAHRVELGLEHQAKDVMKNGGLFELVHPSMPFMLRENVALGANVLSENVNKTLLLDKMLYIKKQLQYNATAAQIVARLAGAWGEAGAMSQMVQCTKLMDRPCWEALSADYGGLGVGWKTDPVFTIPLMLHPLFKECPTHLRGEIMREMIFRTHGMKAEIFPGGNTKVSKPRGREQALWIATIWTVLRNELSLEGKHAMMGRHVEQLGKAEQEALREKYSKVESCVEIGRAVGVGDGKEWAIPVHAQKKISVNNVILSVVGILGKLLGEIALPAKAQAEEKDEDVDRVTAEKKGEFKEHAVDMISDPIILHGDTTKEAMWNRVKDALKSLAQNNGIVRVHVVSSPPWGVLHDHEVADDAALTGTDVALVKHTQGFYVFNTRVGKVHL